MAASLASRVHGGGQTPGVHTEGDRPLAYTRSEEYGGGAMPRPADAIVFALNRDSGYADPYGALRQVALPGTFASWRERGPTRDRG
jgi:hypothetical protein